MAQSDASTQKFVPIRDIKDNVVILENGQMCRVLLASSINFALKSQDEQEAILHQFQSFLNTLDFTLQFYVQSRRLNIEPYLQQLREREDQQDNSLMRIQLQEYIAFVRSFTEEVDVMNKSFFVIIPYTASPINFSKSITNLFSAGSSEPRNSNSFEEKRLQLEQRVSIVESGLSRLGIRTVTLGKDELVELFYHIFNPRDATGSAPQIDSEQ